MHLIHWNNTVKSALNVSTKKTSTFELVFLVVVVVVVKIKSKESLYFVLFVFSVASFGFGVMSGLFSMVNVLADIAGPGSVGLYGDSQFFPVYSGTYRKSYVNYIKRIISWNPFS